MSLTTRKWPVSALTLKWVAIVTMVIDHVGVISYDWLGWGKPYLFLRFIGRTGFPLFAFLLAEGFRHTRNRWAYLRNLLIFAVISEIPYDLINDWEGRYSARNIFWGLSLGLLGMMGAEAIVREGDKRRVPRPVTLLCALIPMAAAVCAGEVIRIDYGYWGVLLILMVYSGEVIASFLIRDKITPQTARNIGAAVAAVLWMILYDIAHNWLNEIYGLPAGILILLYNGERGQSRLPKWFFYGFYPAQFLILHALRLTVIPWLLGPGNFR
ncbi:MAG: hypothetical protein IJQ81_12305 [Oscillibacter sp.]|nr:hypothetical protein [Oscillibacter sp.]